MEIVVRPSCGDGAPYRWPSHQRRDKFSSARNTFACVADGGEHEKVFLALAVLAALAGGVALAHLAAATPFSQSFPHERIALAMRKLVRGIKTGKAGDRSPHRWRASAFLGLVLGFEEPRDTPRGAPPQLGEHPLSGDFQIGVRTLRRVLTRGGGHQKRLLHSHRGD